MIGHDYYGLQHKFWREHIEDWTGSFAAVAINRANGGGLETLLVPIMPFVEYQYPPTKWPFHPTGKF